MLLDSRISADLKPVCTGDSHAGKKFLYMGTMTIDASNTDCLLFRFSWRSYLCDNQRVQFCNLDLFYLFISESSEMLHTID